MMFLKCLSYCLSISDYDGMYFPLSWVHFLTVSKLSCYLFIVSHYCPVVSCQSLTTVLQCLTPVLEYLTFVLLLSHSISLLSLGHLLVSPGYLSVPELSPYPGWSIETLGCVFPHFKSISKLFNNVMLAFHYCITTVSQPSSVFPSCLLTLMIIQGTGSSSPSF